MKRMISAVLSAALLLSLTACGNSGASSGSTIDLAENGFYNGITASDCVTLGDYKNLTVSASDIEVTDEDIDAEISNQISSFSTTENVKEGTVADGDTVNIDYVGYVDGTAFEGGSTDNAGTTVTIGVTSYIDDFLEQLIGHTPGETFDIYVTFPDPYTQNSDLAGKDARFTVTINYIVKVNVPELTDAFVAENIDGLSTVDEYRAYIGEAMYKGNLQNAIYRQLLKLYTVNSYPEGLVEATVEEMTAQYTQQASYYDLDLETYLSYIGISDLTEEAKAQVGANLMLQAICEKEDLTVTDDFINEIFGEDVANNYIAQYGRPYVCQYLLAYLAVEYLEDYTVIQ